MGAFFMYRVDAPIRLADVERLFADKGLTAPDEYRFANWTLRHYRKRLVPNESLAVHRPEASLFALGTFAYRGCGLRASLDRILDDHLQGRLDLDGLAGAYCLLFANQSGITILTDPMNLLHIFASDDEMVVSSSFAAVLKAGPGQYALNVPAAVENIICGYIVGPDTLARGIRLLDARGRQGFHPRGLEFLEHRQLPEFEPAAEGGFIACVESQLSELDRYFEQFRALVDENAGVDIGLSGGYDSRLLILMARRHFGRVSAHSHFHRTLTADEICAEQVAQLLDVPFFRFAAAKQPAEMDVEELALNVKNASAYNDGRVIHDYSWLVYFRTRWYREAVLRDMRFGMNGLGGELYRNHQSQILRRVDTRAWIRARVLGPSVVAGVHPHALDAALEYLLAKAGAVLGADLSRSITRHQSRRWFGEIFSVYGAAVRMCIDNQLAFSLSPFLDRGPRLASYRALPHIGLDGSFEAAMIARLNPAAAAIRSTYGYPFDRPAPLRDRLKCAARGLVPYGIQAALRRTPAKSRARALFDYLYARQPMVRQATDIMRMPAFGLEWNNVLNDGVLTMRALSLGIMLLEFESCFCLE